MSWCSFCASVLKLIHPEIWYSCNVLRRARVCVCVHVLGILDLADVKTRKSAFKRGFSANVAKEPNGRPSMNEAWGIYTCAHNNVQQKWATMRDYVYKSEIERERARGRVRKSMCFHDFHRKMCFHLDSKFYMVLVCFTFFSFYVCII